MSVQYNNLKVNDMLNTFSISFTCITCFLIAEWKRQRDGNLASGGDQVTRLQAIQEALRRLVMKQFKNFFCNNMYHNIVHNFQYDRYIGILVKLFLQTNWASPPRKSRAASNFHHVWVGSGSLRGLHKRHHTRSS